MTKHKLMTVAIVAAVVAAGLLANGLNQRADADATSLIFSPTAINLEGDGASTTVDLVVTDLGIDAADTVQINIQHTSQFTITLPTCGALYNGGSASGATAVTGGTAFTCTLQDGPLQASGVVASFTITKNDDVTGEAVLNLETTRPFRTAGAER